MLQKKKRQTERKEEEQQRVSANSSAHLQLDIRYQVGPVQVNAHGRKCRKERKSRSTLLVVIFSPVEFSNKQVKKYLQISQDTKVTFFATTIKLFLSTF